MELISGRMRYSISFSPTEQRVRKKAERVAVSATPDAESFFFTRFEFVVSNFRNVSPETVLALYQKRGTMENFIKEIKNVFYFDKTESSAFTENSARMALACISYNLFHLFKKRYFLIQKEIQLSPRYALS
ncbi:transposase [Enterococcus casseliflavus]|nr:transposase [Enterococcus casseliflavus]